MAQDETAKVGDAVRHAANNLVMVALSNLDLLARAVPADSPASRQAARGRQAAERLLAILLPYTRLDRAPAMEEQRPEAVLRSLLPLLELMAGGQSVALTASEVGALPLPRPGLDLALLGWARAAGAECPRGTPLGILLDSDAAGGATLRIRPVTEGGEAALGGLAEGAFACTDGTGTLLLPAA